MKIISFVIALAVIAAGLSFVCIRSGSHDTRDIYSEMAEKGYTGAEQSELKLVFSNLDSIVDAVRKGLKEHSPRITISFVSKGEYREDISRLVRLMTDQALLPTGKPDEGDYIRYQYGGYTLSYNHVIYNEYSAALSGEPAAGDDIMPDDTRYKYTFTIEPEYYTDIAEEEKTEEAIESALKELGIAWYMTEEERIVRIHDYLCSHVAYDRIHKNHPAYRYNATAYGALVYGHASCQGFCTAMYRLLMESGVDCRIVTGYIEWEGETEYHSWIIARVGDAYYNIDPTWDAQLGTADYLLKGEADFSDHTRSGEYEGGAFAELYPMG